jgi:hypothetical protein
MTEPGRRLQLSPPFVVFWGGLGRLPPPRSPYWKLMKQNDQFYTYLPMKMVQSVPKRRYIKFRRRGITQKKTYKTLYMFRTVSPSIIRSLRLYKQHHTIQVLWLLASKQPTTEPVRYDAVCTVLDSWWRTERPSKTCRVSFQNKINLRYCASGWFYYRNTQHGETGGLQTYNTIQHEACKQNTIWPLIKVLYWQTTQLCISNILVIYKVLPYVLAIYISHQLGIRYQKAQKGEGPFLTVVQNHAKQ